MQKIPYNAKLGCKPAALGQKGEGSLSRDEQRRAQQLRVQKKRRRRKLLLFAVLFLLILGVGTVLILFVFFHITGFEVQGNSRYTAEEVIGASGIAEGENLFLCNTEKAAARITEKLPYVESVSIERRLPDKLVITVEEAQLKLAVQQGNSYLILTGSGKVLEIGATELPEGAVLLKGVRVKSATPGQQASFPPETTAQTQTESGDQTQETTQPQAPVQSASKTVLDHLLQAVQQAGFSGITQIDLTDPEDIRLTYQGRIELLLGEDDGLAQKLSLGMEVIAREEENNPEPKGILNLTIPKKAFFRETVEPETKAVPTQAETQAKPAA